MPVRISIDELFEDYRRSSIPLGLSGDELTRLWSAFAAAALSLTKMLDSMAENGDPEGALQAIHELATDTALEQSPPWRQ